MKTVMDFCLATEIVISVFTLGVLVIRKWNGKL